MTAHVKIVPGRPSSLIHFKKAPKSVWSWGPTGPPVKQKLMTIALYSLCYFGSAVVKGSAGGDL